MYEDWYTSAWLGLLDHQTDWYYTPAKDEDKVSVIILNTGLVRGGKSSRVTSYGSISQTVMRIYLGDAALYGSLQLTAEAPAVP